MGTRFHSLCRTGLGKHYRDMWRERLSPQDLLCVSINTEFPHSCASTYGHDRIRLAAHFHSECLIDREHYIDWILSSLEATSQPKLPIWLLISQVYWEDILKYRRFGRRLTTTLLNRFSEVWHHIHLYFLVRN